MHSSTSSQRFLEELHIALASYQVDRPFVLDRDPKASRILLVGNGGSAAVAAHIANDLVKAGRSALTLTDAATLTCLANDYGYEEAFAHQVRVHGSAGDTLIAISSSGRSANVRYATHTAGYKGMTVVTFTGFDHDNLLRQEGEHNYYVPSNNYGVVECAHLAILHSIINPGEV